MLSSANFNSRFCSLTAEKMQLYDTVRLFFWYALNKINKIWLHENVRVCAKLLKFNKKWNWCPRVTQSQVITDDLNASANCFAAHVEHDTPRRKVNVKSWMPALFWTCLLSDSCVRTGPYICSYLIENKTCPKMYVKSFQIYGSSR